MKNRTEAERIGIIRAFVPGKTNLIEHLALHGMKSNEFDVMLRRGLGSPIHKKTSILRVVLDEAYELRILHHDLRNLRDAVAEFVRNYDGDARALFPRTIEAREHPQIRGLAEYENVAEKVHYESIRRAISNGRRIGLGERPQNPLLLHGYASKADGLYQHGLIRWNKQEGGFYLNAHHIDPIPFVQHTPIPDVIVWKYEILFHNQDVELGDNELLVELSLTPERIAEKAGFLSELNAGRMQAVIREDYYGGGSDASYAV